MSLEKKKMYVSKSEHSTVLVFHIHIFTYEAYSDSQFLHASASYKYRRY